MNTKVKLSLEEMIEVFENNNIDYDTSVNGCEILALYKMSTHTGEDCSEWIDGETMIDILIETKVI